MAEGGRVKNAQKCDHVVYGWPQGKHKQRAKQQASFEYVVNPFIYVSENG